MLDSLSNNKLKPLYDLIKNKSPNNVVYGYVSDILKNNNNSIIGYKVKIGAESYNIYDNSDSNIKTRDLVTVSVPENGGFKLSSILGSANYRVDITTTNLSLNDG